MSTTLRHTRLAALLNEPGLSQAELARRSRTLVTTIARAAREERASAEVRARIVAAINARRTELLQPDLGASDIFPAG